MGGLNLMCKCKVFFKFFLYSFVGTIANIYLAEKSLSIANWPIEDKKQYVFARQLPHTKSFLWQLEYGYGLFTNIIQKGLLSDGDPRMLLLQWGWGSLGFC